MKGACVVATVTVGYPDRPALKSDTKGNCFYDKGHSSSLFHHSMHITFGAYYIMEQYQIKMTTFFIKHVVCNQHSFLAREQLQGYNYQ
jgi:hypothetical protein